MIGVMPKMPERIAARLDADDRLAGLVRRHHGGAARRDVVAEDLGSWTRRKIVAGGTWIRFISGMPCAFNALLASPSSADQRVAVALGDGVGDRRQRGDRGG